MSRLDLPLQSLQIYAHLRGELVSRFAIFFERSANDFFEFHGESVIHLTHRSWRLPEDGFLKLRPGDTCECAFPRRHFIKDQTERKQVRARIQLLASHLFRRHVTCGAHRDSGSTKERTRRGECPGLVFWFVRTVVLAMIRGRRIDCGGSSKEQLG